MAPRLSLSNTPARLAMINKAMTDSRHKKRFLLKVKERLRLKMARNKRISNPNIEVITLDDDDSISTPSTSSFAATTTKVLTMPSATTTTTTSAKSTKNKQQTKPKLLKTPKTSQKNKRKRTSIAKPLANIVNTVADLVTLKNVLPSKPPSSTATTSESNIASDPLKRSLDSASSLRSTASSGHGSMSTDQDVIDLDSGDEEDLNEISIIEVKEKDCHTLSFMNTNTSVLNATKSKEEIAVIEHIQHDLNSRESNLKEKVGHAVVYTDGSCREFYRTGENVAGIGVFWGPDDKRNVSELLDGFASANRAEIHAAIRAIKTAIEYKYEFVTVYTDSIYLIEGSKRFINKRMSRGERCRADFAILAPLLKKINVKFKKVPAHNGIRGNEFADQLAKEITRKKIQEMCKFARKGRRNFY